MNIHEDFARDEIEETATGVLFGNAYRLKNLEERDDFFTKKCISAVKRTGTVLVRTPDLFTVAQYLSGTTDKKFASRCRKAIFSAAGEIVTFPERPKSGKKKDAIRSPDAT